MELIKGLNRDVHPNKLGNGFWKDAKNIVIDTKFRDIANERGFVRNEEIGIKTNLIGYIEISDKLVLFYQDAADYEIGILDEDNNYTIIIKDAALNFDAVNPIEGTYTINYKNEIVIVWWEGIGATANPPRILNIDCLPFELNPDKSLVDPSQIYLLKLFPDIGCATFSIDSVSDDGGELTSGAYQFVYAYELVDGTITNYSGISNWVSIYDSRSTDDFLEIDGCISDTPTTKTINVRLSNLDINYSKVVIGVIKKVGGVISAFRTSAITIPSTGEVTFNYANEDNLIDESLGNLIVPTASYSKVQTGATLNNRLYLANVQSENQIDYQAYANNIKAGWIRAEDINLTSYENSYKDPVIIFDKRGYMSGEAYAFYIVFKLKDGTFSEAFHIPGRAPATLAAFGNLPENSRINDMITAGFPPADATEFTAIDVDARYHEVYSTALQTGELGFFENQNEVYLDTDCSDIKDATGTVIDTLRNQKVRHHVMPSIDQLEAWGNPFYSPSTGNAGTLDAVFTVDDWNGNNEMDFTLVSVDGAKFINVVTTDKLEIEAVNDISGYFNIEAGTNWNSSNHDYRITKVDSGGATTLIDFVRADGGFFQGKFRYSFYEYINLAAGDKLVFEIEEVGSGIKPNLFGDIAFRTINVSDSDASTKPIGVKFTDVNIPAEIADKVECYYICYAKRTPSNSIKIGSGLISNRSGSTVQKFFENFDILNNLSAITPAYLRTQLVYASVDTTAGYRDYVYSSYASDVRTRQIFNSFYLGPNVSLPVNNINRGVTYYMELVNNLANLDFFGELFSYKKNVYQDFVSQQLIIASIAINTSTITTDIVYGGDTFVNAIGTRTNGPSTSHYVGEAVSNTYLRHDDEVNNYVYPIKTLPGDNDEPIFGEYFGYNSDYSSVNDTIQLTVFNCVDGCNNGFVNEFPYRIARSSVVGNESTILGWRKFFENDYVEMPDRAKGAIQKIIAYNDVLIIYQLYSMFIAQFKDKLFTNDVETYLGTGDIFDRPPREIISDGKGYAGNNSKWCTFLCKHGVVHVDQIRGKVFLFNGQIQELSSQNLKNFFREFGPLDNTFDNPFTGQGYSGSYCEETNRIIICRRGDNLSFTISYSFDLKAWVSFHDHTGIYMFNRNGTYNYNDRFTYKVDEGNSGEFSNYLPDNNFIPIIHDSYIDVVFAEPINVTKVFRAFFWNTKVYDHFYNNGGIQYEPPYLYDKTIDSVVVYNDNQLSGEIDLVKSGTLIRENNNNRNSEYDWKFNDFVDLIKDKNEPILREDGLINLLNVKNNKAWFNNSKFISKFIVLRMIIDNTNNLTVLIQNVIPNIKKSQR